MNRAGERLTGHFYYLICVLLASGKRRGRGADERVARLIADERLGILQRGDETAGSLRRSARREILGASLCYDRIDSSLTSGPSALS